MKWMILLAMFVASSSYAAGPTPIQPKKGLEISIPMAAVAGSSKKIAVSLVISVRPDEVIRQILIDGENYTRVPLADAKAVGQALEKMADGMKVGDRVEVGGLVISVQRYSNTQEKYLQIKGKSSFIGGESMDAEGASAIAQALLKAEGYSAWFDTKLDALRKE